jgi:hypothetical protein
MKKLLCVMLFVIMVLGTLVACDNGMIPNPDNNGNNGNSAPKEDVITVALDLAHCHIFDKDTEVTLCARSLEDKENVVALQVKAVKDREIRLALEAEKKRIEDEKLAKKLARSRKGKVQVEEEALEEVVEENVEE